MTIQDRNKATFRRLLDEVINEGRLDLADQLLTADRPDHQEMGLPPEMTKGYEGFRRVIGMFREGFPDLSFQSDFMVADGDRVVSHNRVSGTHKGAFMGIPPTNKRFSATALDVCRFDDSGKISEHWGVFDMLGVLVQLGVVPAPGKGAGR
jgi:predicted ester cyclase